MKKSILILGFIFILIFQMISFALPSEWAIDIVENSIESKLVPQVLQKNYQSPITRGEYVLLALKILEKNNVEIVVTDTNPFTDILGHKYEVEIIKAYNANLIGGYPEDNSFKPDKEISREEISALMFNLVKKINPEVEIPILTEKYYDENKISSWAKGFIEFSYKNNIISGTGKISGLDRIDPLGKATREQSIILLYKVSKNSTLINRDLGTIKVLKIVNGVEKYEPSNIINDFTFNTNYEMGNLIKSISERANTKIVSLDEKNCYIIYENGSINISKGKYAININILMRDLTDLDLKNDFISLINTIKPSQLVNEEIEKGIISFKSNTDYNYNKSITDKIYLSIFSDYIDKTNYAFNYQYEFE